MKLALDYDQTFTLDPEFWAGFIHASKHRGHEVRIVTVRDDRHDRTQPLIDLEEIVPVIYTRGVAKQFYCIHHAQYAVDVWVDDTPQSITQNSSATPEWLVEWRAKRGEAVPA